jgi:hypothetical protein
MNSSKQQYLDAIRRNSAYPTYRGVIGLIAFVFFAIAAVTALSVVVSGIALMTRSFMGGVAAIVLGLLFAALFFLAGKLFKEAALVHVDMGDSVIDSNSQVPRVSAASGD